MQTDSLQLQQVGETNQNNLVFIAFGLALLALVAIPAWKFIFPRSPGETRRKPP